MQKDNQFSWGDGVSLKEHFDVRLAEMKDSVVLARQSMEKRLDGMNEFRDALKDQTGTMTTKAEFNITVNQLQNDIRSLRESRAEMFYWYQQILSLVEQDREQ